MQRKFRPMSGSFKLAAASALCAAMSAVPAAKAATLTEGVDPTTITNAYVNVFNLTGTTYQYGFVNSLAGNPATFTGNSLTLAPNTSITTGGTTVDTVQVDASTYAENTTSGGDTVTFNFTVSADSLAPGYSVEGFAADFLPNFSSSVQSDTMITGPGNYTVSQTIAPGDVAQYGFTLIGPNASTLTAPALGAVTIIPTGTTATPEPASLGLIGLAGAALIRRRRSV